LVNIHRCSYFTDYLSIIFLIFIEIFAFQRSMGGMEIDGNQSVTAWGINVGSKLAQGVSKIYSNIFSSG